MNSEVDGCVSGCMIYLTAEQLSTNAHKMEMLLS